MKTTLFILSLVFASYSNAFVIAWDLTGASGTTNLNTANQAVFSTVTTTPDLASPFGDPDISVTSLTLSSDIDLVGQVSSVNTTVATETLVQSASGIAYAQNNAGINLTSSQGVGLTEGAPSYFEFTLTNNSSQSAFFSSFSITLDSMSSGSSQLDLRVLLRPDTSGGNRLPGAAEFTDSLSTSTTKTLFNTAINFDSNIAANSSRTFRIDWSTIIPVGAPAGRDLTANFTRFEANIIFVPEPSSALLLGAASGFLLIRRKRN
jgi:hypothetical protein